jgi:tRNA nucleotidyltransferase (CCA-adding enzyme)
MQGIHPEAAVANFPFLTAKMAAKEIAALKKSFVRQGFVAEIEALEDEAKEFAAQFSAKTAAAPSQAWKLLHAAKPESVLVGSALSKSARCAG